MFVIIMSSSSFVDNDPASFQMCNIIVVVVVVASVVVGVGGVGFGVQR